MPHKEQAHIGTGKPGGLKAVPRASNRPQQNPNRSITGVFISRLQAKTTAAQIAVHIRRETGKTVKPEKLQTKFPNYSSFYIPCSGSNRSNMMDLNLWPKGALVKPYIN